MKKTVIITGASKGIGAAMAILFARKGYNVVICYNDSYQTAKLLSTSLSSQGYSVMPFKVNVTNKLDSKSFLATGKLNNFSRESIKESILENGGKYSSGINKSLDYLIVGENAGKAKLDKATALNIKIISEEEYLKMIQSI